MVDAKVHIGMYEHVETIWVLCKSIIRTSSYNDARFFVSKLFDGFKLIMGAARLRQKGGSFMEKFIITIGREFGSGGLDVGRMLSDKLNVKCYDKELLSIAAKESGLCQEIFENHESAHLPTMMQDSLSASFLMVSNCARNTLWFKGISKNGAEVYPNYYSSKKWGDSRSYHLTLDSSQLGIAGCCDMILNYMDIQQKNRNK